jgi:hypothetical protein
MQTHCATTMELDVFRTIVCPHAASVTPSVFDGTTPVVVASLMVRTMAARRER